MKNMDWKMWVGVAVALILIVAVAFITFSLVRQVPAWWWAR